MVIFLSHSIRNMSKGWFSVNIQQWHDMTCAEYNEYILLLSTFWIKMFWCYTSLISLEMYSWSLWRQNGQKKLLEKNTSDLLCDSVLYSSPRIFFEKGRILSSCPSRFRFRTSPYSLMVVLRTSWGKNKCRALSWKSMICLPIIFVIIPDGKFHGANMRPIWGRQDPCWAHELCYLVWILIVCWRKHPGNQQLWELPSAKYELIGEIIVLRSIIEATIHARHGVPNNRQLDWFGAFIKISNLHITGSLWEGVWCKSPSYLYLSGFIYVMYKAG